MRLLHQWVSVNFHLGKWKALLDFAFSFLPFNTNKKFLHQGGRYGEIGWCCFWVHQINIWLLKIRQVYKGVFSPSSYKNIFFLFQLSLPTGTRWSFRSLPAQAIQWFCACYLQKKWIRPPKLNKWVSQELLRKELFFPKPHPENTWQPISGAEQCWKRLPSRSLIWGVFSISGTAADRNILSKPSWRAALPCCPGRALAVTFPLVTPCGTWQWMPQLITGPF